MEKEFKIGQAMTQIIFGVVKNTNDINVKTFCEEYHIARERMTSKFFTVNIMKKFTRKARDDRLHSYVMIASNRICY